MQRVCFFFLICLSVVLCSRGVLELDSSTFGKIVDGHRPVLVVFQEFSWKEPKDYDLVASDLKSSDVIVAKVDISANDEFRDQFQLETFPAFRFFPKGETEKPQAYSGEESPSALLEIQNLRELAAKYKSDTSSKATMLSQIQEIDSNLEGAEKKYASFLLATLKKIEEKGNAFVKSEKSRLKGLIASKNTQEAKKAEFTQRLNILDLLDE